MSQLPTGREAQEKITELRTQAARLMYEASLLAEQAARLEDSFARARQFDRKGRGKESREYISDPGTRSVFPSSLVDACPRRAASEVLACDGVRAPKSRWPRCLRWIFSISLDTNGYAVSLPFSTALRRLFAEFRGVVSPLRIIQNER